MLRNALERLNELMASAETSSVLEQKADNASLKVEGWRPSAIAADIATLGSGTVVAGLFNVALVFLVPRFLSVEDYGYWRTFGLYAGYVGFLHLGFADGALLSWAGRSFGEFRNEILPSLRFLLWQQILIVGSLCLVLGFVLHGEMRFVGVAVALCAPLYNLTTLLQFSLQAARLFRPVAISAIATPALFCAFVLLLVAGRWSFGYRAVVSLFLFAWCIPLVFLLWWTKPWSGEGRAATKKLATDCLASGWPIVAANTGVNLVLNADRLAVSWTATIQNFAQYSLAASAMAVPITAIQACSKVVFSHLASLTSGGRKRIYGSVLRSFLLVWMFLLPFYFLLEVILRLFLPKYVPSLEFARVLLLGIPFLAAIQILHMNYAYLHGMQKHFLLRTTAVLTVSLAAISLIAFGTGSLKTVAAVQVAILGSWWLFNEWTLRDLTGQTQGDWINFVGVYVLVGLSYWLMSGLRLNVGMRLALYYFGAAILAWIGCLDEVRFFIRLLMGRPAAPVEG